MDILKRGKTHKTNYMRTKTWSELKDFVNSLTDEQLKTPLIVEVAELPWRNYVHAYVATDDFLINAGDNDDYGYRSELEHCEGFDEDDYYVQTEKGTPVISCDIFDPAELAKSDAVWEQTKETFKS